MSGILNELVGTKFNAAPSTSYNKQTVLLLAGDGTNGAQNNTFIDGSSNAFTVTRVGNTTQGTFSPFSSPNGYWSNYFNGTSDYVSAANNAALNILGSAFTIELWFYLTAPQSDLSLIAKYDSSGAGYLFRLSTTGIRWYAGTNGVVLIDRAYTFAQGTWYHVAVTCDNTNTAIFINGVKQGASGGVAGSSLNSTVTFNVGLTQTTTSYFPGYMSNVRVVKGTDVYGVGNSSFTVPTTPLTAITNTSLLTCQSNSFKDNSTNNFSITSTGTPSVSNFGPFAPTAAYSSSTNGGSGYFDGNSDYLSTPNVAALRLGSGDFTVEAWIYPLRLTNTLGQAICGTYGLVSGPGEVGWLMIISSAGYLRLIMYNQPTSVAFGFNSTSLLKINTWTHVAMVRSGSTITAYINGVADGTATSSYDEASSTNSFYVGTARIDSYSPSVGHPDISFTGYISNVRLVKGTAVYTSNFTPPTGPLAAITNTSILLNSVNAGVIDNSETNNIETVGNAQISTSVKKYGSGSMSFDGTGDWLIILDKPELRFQAASFTVECWLYLNATGSARGIVGKGTSTTGWLLSTNTSNQVVFTYGSSTITSTASLSASRWYHIAVVRSGTGTNQTKIYINGVNDGIGTVANTFSETNSMYVGADRTAGSALNGYIDDMRITNGVAVYTSNFTPPTAALPLY